MRKFKVTIKGEAKIVPADSKKDLRAMLRHQLNKRHLVGVGIEVVENHPDQNPGADVRSALNSEPNYSLASAVAGHYKVLCECGCGRLFDDSEVRTDDRGRLIGMDCGRKKIGREQLEREIKKGDA